MPQMEEVICAVAARFRLRAGLCIINLLAECAGLETEEEKLQQQKRVSVPTSKTVTYLLCCV